MGGRKVFPKISLRRERCQLRPLSPAARLGETAQPKARKILIRYPAYSFPTPPSGQKEREQLTGAFLFVLETLDKISYPF